VFAAYTSEQAGFEIWGDVVTAFETFEMLPNDRGSADDTRFVQTSWCRSARALTDIGLAEK
jgi:hypothetical protein